MEPDHAVIVISEPCARHAVLPHPILATELAITGWTHYCEHGIFPVTGIDQADFLSREPQLTRKRTAAHTAIRFSVRISHSAVTKIAIPVAPLCITGTATPVPYAVPVFPVAVAVADPVLTEPPY